MQRYAYITLCIVMLACTGLARASDIYVDRDNACPGLGSASSPFCSIQNAFNLSTLGCGDHIRIMSSTGEYSGQATLTKSGCDGNPIVIEPSPGHVPILCNGNLGNFQGSINLANNNNVTIQGLTFACTGKTTSHFALSMINTTSATNSRNITIQGNTFTNWGTSSGPVSYEKSRVINIDNTANQCDSGQNTCPDEKWIRNVVIKDNTIYGYIVEGIRVAGIKDGTIENNGIQNGICAVGSDGKATVTGIHVSGESTGITIRQNAIESLDAQTCSALGTLSGMANHGIYIENGAESNIAEYNYISNKPIVDAVGYEFTVLGNSDEIDRAAIYNGSRAYGNTYRYNVINGWPLGYRLETSGNAGSFTHNTIVDVATCMLLHQGTPLTAQYNLCMVGNSVNNGNGAVHTRSTFGDATGVDRNIYWVGPSVTPTNRVGAWNKSGQASDADFSTLDAWRALCNCDAGSLNEDWRPRFYSGGDLTPDTLSNARILATDGTTIGALHLSACSTDRIGSTYGTSVTTTCDPPTIPPAPSNVVAMAGNGQVALSWDSVAGATFYRVKRGTVSGGPYTEIAQPSINQYTNSSVTNGTTYYYVIITVRNGAESVVSSQVSAMPEIQSNLPVAPQTVTASASGGVITIGWSEVGDSTSYHVKRGTIQGGPYTEIARVGGTLYNDYDVSNDITYYYVISSDNGAESTNSSEVSAMPVVVSQPSVALDAPHDGAMFNDVEDIPITVTATGDIVGVTFLMDDADYGDEDIDPPYAIEWNTEFVSNGPHRWQARGRTSGGEYVYSNTSTVLVSKASGGMSSSPGTGK